MFLRNIFEDMQRTGQGKTAVVGWGRGMGHKGHMMLASSVITQAGKVGGDPYFVVSKTVGKDDPITPDEKIAIYKKVFPQSGHIFQPATDEIPDLTRVLANLNQQGYTNVTVVLGADQVKAFQYLKNYNNKPDKSGNILYSFDSLDVISRQETGDPSAGEEGPRATPMRQVLMDPSKSEQEQFAVWRDAMSPEIGDDEVRALMAKAKERMTAMSAPKPKKAKVAEQDSPAMAHTAKSLENPPKVMQHRARRDQERDKQWMGTQIAKNDRTSKDEWGDFKEGEADYGSEWDEKVKRVGQMAKEGPRKTVWDPVKRVYKTVPVNAPQDKKVPKPVAERLLNSLVRPLKINEDAGVLKLQQMLISKGARIEADGIMGPLTRAAMKQFGGGGASAPTKPVAQKTPALSKPGVEKKIAGVVTSGPGYTDVKTTDGELQRREGTRNWRNNNPGNIRKGGYAQSKGAVGDDGAFAVFPSLEVGMDAKEALIFGPKYINLSIQDAISRYAPPSENDTQGYIKQVCQATGTTPDITLSKLNPAQRDALLKTISKVEGFKVGNIKVVSNVAEGIGSTLAGLGLAGAMALGGAGHAQAADLSNFNTQYLQQVVSGEHPRPMVSIDDAKAELQARTNGKQQTVSPAASNANSGFSKEWLQKAADPNRVGRYLISVEKAQDLLSKMNAVDEAKIKGADGKACWDGYRYNGTAQGKDKCVKVSESVEDIMDNLINKIITNEAIQNNRR